MDEHIHHFAKEVPELLSETLFLSNKMYPSVSSTVRLRVWAQACYSRAGTGKLPWGYCHGIKALRAKTGIIF